MFGGMSAGGGAAAGGFGGLRKAAVSAPVAPPPEDPVVAARKREAALLFGGVGEPTEPTSMSASLAKERADRRAARRMHKGGDDAEPASTTGGAGVGGAGAGGGDLFGGMSTSASSGVGTPTPAASGRTPQAPPAAVATAHDDDDIFGLRPSAPATAATTATATPPPRGSPTSGLGDLFGGGAASGGGGGGGDLFAGMSSGGGGAGGGATSVLGRVGLPLPSEIMGVVGAGVVTEPLGRALDVVARDARVEVGVTRAFREESLVVVVWVGNVSGQALSGVRILPSAVPFLKPTVHAGPLAAAPGGTHGVIASLPVGGVAAVAVKYTISNVPSSTSVAYRVQFDGLPGSAPLDAVVPLPVHFLLRPTVMATPDFGAKWTNPAHGAAVTISAPPASPALPWTLPLVAQRFAAARFHVVESIARTSETIAAAQLMGTPQAALIHAKVTPAEVKFTVKTANPAFSTAVANAVKDALAKV
jgi:Adaptin AP4 complex epsilon appendage platform